MTDAPAQSDASWEAFGTHLRELRLRAGLSQVALAGEELHPSYVSLLEAGKRRPTSAAITVLARRLGVSEEELAVGTGYLPEGTVVLVEAALGTSRPSDAAALAEDALSSGVVVERSTTLGFRFFLAYATALERCARVEDATAEYERLREVAEAHPRSYPWLPLVMALVRCYRDAGDLHRAIDVGEQAMGRCRQLGLVGVDGQAALVSTLAGAYSERGDHLRAKVILDGLAAEVRGREDPQDQAYALWNLAINAVERGHAGEGLRLSQQAAALLAETEDQRSRARIEVTRAWVLLAQDPPDPTTARRLLRATLPRLRELAGTVSLASAETELARCELLLGRPDVARRLAQSALARLPDDVKIGRARALVALGAALADGGEAAAGLTELAEAAEALDSLGSSRIAAPVWRQLSDLYRRLGDTERALLAAGKALDATGVVSEPLHPEPAVGRRSRRPASKPKASAN